MKLKNFLFGLCLACLLIGCSAGKAKSAFEDGKISLGSTYEEMVEAIGEPTKEKANDKGRMATYSTVLTNTHIFILLEKDANGVEHVTAYTDDNLETIAYSKKLGLPLF